MRLPAATARDARHDAAVIVAIEDYQRMGARTGAQAAAAAWYRYFRETRGVPDGRILLLRDGEATAKRIAQAIEVARFRIHRDGTLWFVFIGHISTPAPDAGALWLRGGDGTQGSAGAHSVPIAQVLDRSAYGRHPRAVAVLDGCWTGGQPGGSGVVASPPPPFRYTGEIDEPWRVEPIPGIPGAPKTLGALISEALNATHMDSARARREPSDVAIYSAGVGEQCIEQLPGTKAPALSYLLLGALRGWGDRNGDGIVTSVEALAQVTMSLRAATDPAATSRPRPEFYGAELVLARGVAEAGPTLAQLGSAGRAHATQLLAEPVPWMKDPMIRIDRGPFKMGCWRRGDRDCERDESPVHRVTLSRFFIDPLEVTQAEYADCVAAGKCTPIDPSRCFVWNGGSFARGGRMPEKLLVADHPAVCVTWFQARAYCASVGKRLPKEAEWERAAAGSPRRRYPWGDAAPTCKRAHFDGCGEHTRPVGGRPGGATPEGVQDLAGNVSEWVHDWYDRDAYRRSVREDPTGPSGGLVRVVRGGSYYDNASLLRAAYRYGLNPRSGFSTVGLRCAR